MALHEQSLLSANHQRTTSRTDPHTHDPHFSQPSPAVLPARSADRRGRARQSQIHGFLMQKWKQACSCHLNVSPSRKRPESVTHDRHGRKDRPGDRGTARGAKPQAKLAPLIVPSFEDSTLGVKLMFGLSSKFQVKNECPMRLYGINFPLGALTSARDPRAGPD